tara:strand:- start:3334 stop:3621 length:288 start_codon:yes stop_codon:yes gene_type:complete
MNSTSRELIKNLNERLFTQSTVIETLCELLIEKEVVSHDELEKLIMSNVKTRKKQVQELKEKLSDEITINIEEDINESFDETLMEGLYWGPIGKA